MFVSIEERPPGQLSGQLAQLPSASRPCHLGTVHDIASIVLRTRRRVTSLVVGHCRSVKFFPWSATL